MVISKIKNGIGNLYERLFCEPIKTTNPTTTDKLESKVKDDKTPKKSRILGVVNYSISKVENLFSGIGDYFTSSHPSQKMHSEGLTTSSYLDETHNKGQSLSGQEQTLKPEAEISVNLSNDSEGDIEKTNTGKSNVSFSELEVKSKVPTNSETTSDTGASNGSLDMAIGLTQDGQSKPTTPEKPTNKKPKREWSSILDPAMKIVIKYFNKDSKSEDSCMDTLFKPFDPLIKKYISWKNSKTKNSTKVTEEEEEEKEANIYDTEMDLETRLTLKKQNRTKDIDLYGINRPNVKGYGDGRFDVHTFFENYVKDLLSNEEGTLLSDVTKSKISTIYNATLEEGIDNANILINQLENSTKLEMSLIEKKQMIDTICEIVKNNYNALKEIATKDPYASETSVFRLIENTERILNKYGKNIKETPKSEETPIKSEVTEKAKAAFEEFRKLKESQNQVVKEKVEELTEEQIIGLIAKMYDTKLEQGYKSDSEIQDLASDISKVTNDKLGKEKNWHIASDLTTAISELNLGLLKHAIKKHNESLGEALQEIVKEQYAILGGKLQNRYSEKGNPQDIKDAVATFDEAGVLIKEINNSVTQAKNKNGTELPKNEYSIDHLFTGLDLIDYETAEKTPVADLLKAQKEIVEAAVLRYKAIVTDERKRNLNQKDIAETKGELEYLDSILNASDSKVIPETRNLNADEAKVKQELDNLTTKSMREISEQRLRNDINTYKNERLIQGKTSEQNTALLQKILDGAVRTNSDVPFEEYAKISKTAERITKKDKDRKELVLRMAYELNPIIRVGETISPPKNISLRQLLKYSTAKAETAYKLAEVIKDNKSDEALENLAESLSFYQTLEQKYHLDVKGEQSKIFGLMREIYETKAKQSNSTNDYETAHQMYCEALGTILQETKITSNKNDRKLQNSFEEIHKKIFDVSKQWAKQTSELALDQKVSEDAVENAFKMYESEAQQGNVTNLEKIPETVRNRYAAKLITEANKDPSLPIKEYNQTYRKAYELNPENKDLKEINEWLDKRKSKN